jgi:hypothetical protein
MNGKYVLMAAGLGLAMLIPAYGHIAEQKPGREVDTLPEGRTYVIERTYHSDVVHRDVDRRTDMTFDRRTDLLDIYDMNNNGKLDSSERQQLNRDEAFLAARRLQ